MDSPSSSSPVLPTPTPTPTPKTVRLSLADTLLFDDSFYVFGDHIVFSDKGVPYKDAVAISSSGRLVVKAGHRLHVSDECVRVDFDSFYGMQLHWRTIDAPDEILDFDTFRAGILDHLAVALGRRLLVYVIAPAREPVLAANAAADCILTSFELYNERAEHSEVYVSDGLRAWLFDPHDGLRAVEPTNGALRIADYGVDRLSAGMGFGYYAMRTPDLPAAPGRRFNVYSRFLNYRPAHLDAPAVTHGCAQLKARGRLSARGRH